MINDNNCSYYSKLTKFNDFAESIDRKVMITILLYFNGYTLR